MSNDQGTNLLKTQEVVGKTVISLQGEEVGSVARVIVDPIRGNVVGLTIDVKGWFKGEKGLEFESVNSFGDYAVTIQRSGQVVTLDNLPTIEKLAHDYNMYNMRIITPEGRLIGTVDDFYFDKETGQIEKYILSGGIIKKLFKGRASLPSGSIDKIGKDAVIAVSNVEETLQKEETGLQDNIENLKDDLGHWKDDFEKLWEKTVSKASQISKVVGENIKVAAGSGKDKGKDILGKTEKLVNEKTGQLKNSYETWLERLQAVKNGPEKPLSDEDVNQIIGLKAGKTVVDNEGQVVIETNQEVTAEIIAAAQKAGKTKELLISVASKDLEDKIKSVEKEVEKAAEQ